MNAVFRFSIPVIMTIGFSTFAISNSSLRPLSSSRNFNSNCKDDIASSQSSQNFDLVIVKFGGSAVTQKNLFETIRRDVLETTAFQLNEILSTQSNIQLVMVHGAGSFGHFQAKQFGLGTGGNPEDWKRGVAETRRSVVTLNGIIVDSFLNAGINAVGISQFPTTLTLGKNNISRPGSLRFVTPLADMGFVPVIHGDVVLDDNMKCSVVGGDKIIHWLCENHLASDSNSKGGNLNDSAASIKAVVFLTDVDGVFDQPPSRSGAQLIRRMVVKSDGKIEMPETDLSSHDVTGGIAAKIEAAAIIARLGIPVYIVKAGSESAKISMLGKEPPIGTIICAE